MLKKVVATTLFALAFPSFAHAQEKLPVVLVHGIDDTSRVYGPMTQYLKSQGWDDVSTFDMTPSNGDMPLEYLSSQVDRAIARTLKRTGSPQVDVVAFSMGALVTRHYLQTGHDRYVRRCVLISAPNQGTMMGYLRLNSGGKQMRPNSAFIKDLESRPLPSTQIINLWTPFDGIIVPAYSSVWKPYPSETFNVPIHPWMIKDQRVLKRVSSFLFAP